MGSSAQKEEETKQENAPKGVTPQEIQFYFKASFVYIGSVFDFRIFNDVRSI